MTLGGVHHVTAVTADVGENFRFYTEHLGMRLVKRSVNQDDVSAYHLFYADGSGTPGTDLTFFDWRVPRERRGNHSVVRTGLRVGSLEALQWWAGRLEGLAAGGPLERDGRPTLDFEDPEGQRLSLVVDEVPAEHTVWEGSPVPAAYQIKGLGPITMAVSNLEPTDVVLSSVLGMERVRDYRDPEVAGAVAHVYALGGASAGAELHVAVRPGEPAVRPGAGGVHHVAFRVADDETHRNWQERLAQAGIANSGIIDRYYFRSLYFREPNGVLFEIATDGPGFAVDEDEATLGESVVLPPFLEPQREHIVRNLRPIESTAPAPTRTNERRNP